jgi:hypothetical protein
LHKAEHIKKGFSSLDSDIAVCQTAGQYANWRGNHVSEKALNCLGYVNGVNAQYYPYFFVPQCFSAHSAHLRKPPNKAPTQTPPHTG